MQIRDLCVFQDKNVLALALYILALMVDQT